MVTRLVDGKEYSPSTEAMNSIRVRSKTSTIQPSIPPSIALTFIPSVVTCPTTLFIDQGII